MFLIPIVAGIGATAAAVGSIKDTKKPTNSALENLITPSRTGNSGESFVPFEPLPELPLSSEMVKPTRQTKGGPTTAVSQPARSRGNRVVQGGGRRRASARLRPNPLSAPPSSVTMAPISIGNTVSGMQSQIVNTKTGVMVYGRDFCFSPIGTNLISNWTLVGGAPLTPAAFVDSCLRQFQQMYNKFRFRAFRAHYITSSPTSSSGDIMFYYGKNRESVFLNQTSSNLLPFVISDPNTKIGPQWQNLSCDFSVTGDWKSTDYGMDTDIGEYADGELFLLSKTNTVDAPGYVMFDYVVEFAEMSTIPRLLTLPITKALWNQLGLNINQTTVTDATWNASIGGTTNLSGTPSALPTGTVAGDIFKVIIDRTNSTAGPNSVNVFTSLIQGSPGQSSTSIIMSDGMTVYATYAGNQIWVFYPNAASAKAATHPLTASGAGIITASVLQIWVSYIGSNAAAAITPNF